VEGKKYKDRACCASDNTLPGTCPLRSPDPIETKEQTSNLGVILGATAGAVAAAAVAICAYILLHKKNSKTCGGGKGSSGRPLPSDSGDIEEKDIFVRPTDKREEEEEEEEEEEDFDSLQAELRRRFENLRR
jgi:hypothetical protein